LALSGGGVEGEARLDEVCYNTRMTGMVLSREVINMDSISAEQVMDVVSDALRSLGIDKPLGYKSCLSSFACGLVDHSLPFKMRLNFSRSLASLAQLPGDELPIWRGDAEPGIDSPFWWMERAGQIDSGGAEQLSVAREVLDAVSDTSFLRYEVSDEDDVFEGMTTALRETRKFRMCVWFL